ncbi:MAG: hypothetical protein CMJ08_04990 [Pelagibacterales bacterium]|nr:hypothetical protein [Pelagibacterales bacterium]
MPDSTFYIVHAEVDERNIITWNHELEQERKSAVFDLTNNCYFKLSESNNGPYKIKIKFEEWKLYLFITDLFDNKKYEKKFLVSNIRRIIRDYQIVCENYVEAIKTAPLKKIEAIDVGRRSIHDEGSLILQEILKPDIDINADTSRRLFTLISILSVKI